MKKDIEDFSYGKGVHSNSKQFSIMTLSENGFKEYIDKDSYTHYYLYTKHLDKYKKEMDERLVKKRRFKMVDAVGECQKEECQKEEIIEDFDTNKREMDIPALNTEPGFIKKKTTKNTNFCSTKFNNNFKPKYRKISSNNNNEYSSTIEHLRQSVCSLDSSDIVNTISNFKGGFTSTKVPRIPVDTLQLTRRLSTSHKFNLYNNKMLLSIGEHQSLQKENQKFKKILDNNFKLPQIKRLVLKKEPQQNKLLSNGKYMGEQYDPTNYDYHFMKSNTKRNLYGALFQH